MALLFANNASSTLLHAISDVATTLFVQVTDASLFPLPAAASDYFILVLEDRTKNPIPREILRCTQRTANQMTVVRGEEGSSALAWDANVTVSNRVTAGTLQTLAASVNNTTQLYLGAFASAPTHTLDNSILVPGNLYFDTSLSELFDYTGLAWVPVASRSATAALGLYLGAFATDPSTMPDGSALVDGTLYFSTLSQSLQIYEAGAWQPCTATTTTSGSGSDTPSSANSIDGNQVINGNQTVNGDGTFDNITVKEDGAFGTIHMGGKLLVDAGDISGTIFTQLFPSGNMMQWGDGFTSGSGFTSASITFPQAFTGNPKVQVTTWNNPPGQVVFLTGVSPTGFTVSGPSNHATQFTWMAIGPIV